MEMYTAFAEIYDRFMEDMDYEAWVAYLNALFRRYGISPKLAAELGCGTGNMTIPLAKQGIDMIGIDISREMLSVARQKSADEELDILYLCQDMCEFELYGTVDVILSLCDSMNYITEDEDLLEVFRLVNNYLEPGGLFIFDLNTEHKFKTLLGNNTYGEARDDAAYIWENSYDEASRINEYYMNFFLKEGNETYRRVEECHYERAYTPGEIKDLIAQSGLELVDMFHGFTFEPPKEDSERIYVIARERGKQTDNRNASGK